MSDCFPATSMSGASECVEACVAATGLPSKCGLSVACPASEFPLVDLDRCKPVVEGGRTGPFVSEL